MDVIVAGESEVRGGVMESGQQEGCDYFFLARAEITTKHLDLYARSDASFCITNSNERSG